MFQPTRVGACNAAEGWSRHVSEELANEIIECYAILALDGEDLRKSAALDWHDREKVSMRRRRR
jgi:hypothetical protein